MFQALRWTIQGASCGAAAGVVLLLGGQLLDTRTVAAQSPVSDVVRAKRFDLVGDDGATTGQWMTVDGQAGIVLGRETAQRVVLRPQGLRVNGAFGYTIVSGQSLGTFVDEENGVVIGTPAITMQRGGKSRIALSLVGGTAITLNDASGRLRAVVGSHVSEDTETGEQTFAPESSVALWDEKGRALFRAP